MTGIRSIFFFFALTLTLNFTRGQQPVLKQEVTLFKNNLAFVSYKGIVPTDERSAFRIKPTPAAALGSLWFDGEIKRVVTVKDTVLGGQTITQYATFIQMNKGKKALLTTSEETDTKVELGSVFDDHALFTSGDKWVVVKLKDIIRLELLEAPLLKYPRPIDAIEVIFSSKPKLQPLSWHFLTSGTGWTPAYQIDLLDNNKLRLQLQAIIKTDSLALVGAKVRFAVGVPNFSYSTTPDPLSMGQFIRHYIPESRFSNRLYQTQTLASYDPPVPETEFTAELPDGRQVEELFLFGGEKDTLTLQPGGRATIMLLDKELEYNEHYEAIADNVMTPFLNDYDLNTKGGLPKPENKTIVANHILTFQNKGKEPLTTGPGLILRQPGKVPLAQVLVSFTPAGGKAAIKLAPANDIPIQISEKEVLRSSYKEKNIVYEKITIEGNVEVRNFKDKAVKIKLVRNLPGEAESSVEAWNTTRRVDPIDPLNKSTEAVWSFNLDAKGGKAFTYRYVIIAKKS